MSAKIITDFTATIFHNDTVVTAHNSDPNWERVLEALKTDDYELAIALLDKPKVIREYLKGSAQLRLDGYHVYYGTHSLPDALARRILQMHGEGFNIKPMERFVEKLYQNPSYRAIAETYRFLEHNSLPITDDGDFLAYKKITDNYLDCYTRQIDNSVGRVVEMPRAAVDDNCNNTCSAGLHFCSIDYLKGFGGQRLVALKINPADVVSIPVDYDNAKGRCCRYTVYKELPIEIASGQRDFWDRSVVEMDYDNDDPEIEDDYEPDGYDYYR